jgi:hypothetical protein
VAQVVATFAGDEPGSAPIGTDSSSPGSDDGAGEAAG